LNQIVGLKALMPKGISNDLKQTFPDYIKYDQPDYNPDLQNMNVH